MFESVSMATTKQTYEIIKVLSELSKQGPFSMEEGLGSLKDVIKINSPFASKKAKEIWSKSDKNLELLFTVSGSSTKGYTTTDVQKLLGLKIEEKKKKHQVSNLLLVKKQKHWQMKIILLEKIFQKWKKFL